MIDIFNELYTYLHTALITYDENIKMSSVYTNMPSSYPFVSMEEIENSVYEQTSDSCETENHASVDYEINVYTQNPNKKSEGDKLAQIVDNLFKENGFVRTSRNVLQSNDETKYRIILRYHGIVSKDHVIYRR